MPSIPPDPSAVLDFWFSLERPGKKHDALIRESPAKAVLLFAAETYDAENQINARMFGPYYGVAEDPATGSANGCLAGYLLRHEVLGAGPVEVRVEQGREIRRPSLLRLKAAHGEVTLMNDEFNARPRECFPRQSNRDQ